MPVHPHDMKTRFWPPLRETEKLELLRALSLECGCDDPQTLAVNIELANMKRTVLAMLRALSDKGGL